MRRKTWMIVVTGLWLGAGCGDDDGTALSGFDDAQVVADFADQVVVPTYNLLDTRAAALLDAVDALAADPKDATLAAAQQAWVDARAPWEQSEGFLFGPVDAQGFDPALDTWPLNKTDLDNVLQSSDALTAAYVAALPPTQKGFHTLEFLLFGSAADKTASDLTARELDYLVASAADFADIADRLASSWTVGIAGGTPYRDVFANAGAGSGGYPSLISAAQEIVGGMAGICDEVANGKIADPYDNQDVQLEESRFSNNSLKDFRDNIQSVKNAYVGAVPLAGTSGRGLSDWVRAEDAELDTRILGAIEASLTALDAIPAPFGDAILDADAEDEIVDAQQAIRGLQDMLEGDLTALINGE